MPLTWDLTACKNPEQLESDNEWAITEVLIFSTMGTGIGRITDKNAAEFYARVHLIEKMSGPLLIATKRENGERVDRPISPEDVHRRIGLKTNASFNDESRASWMRRWIKSKLNDFTYDYDKWEKEASTTHIETVLNA